MPRRWTVREEHIKKRELEELQVEQNKTIFEIAKILGIAYQTVYDRLVRLGIPTRPKLKPGYLTNVIQQEEYVKLARVQTIQDLKL